MSEKGEVKPIKKGDYVLATKYSDGDPGDHWCVGFYDELKWGDRHIVLDNAGKPFRLNGFRRAQIIGDAEGQWLIEHIADIEQTMFKTRGADRHLEGRSVWEWLAIAVMQTAGIIP